MNSANLTSAIRGYGTAKEVALVAGCSEATAARYRRGETMPDPIGLARLMGRSRSIAEAMLRLAGLDDLSMDIEEARLRHALHRLQLRRAGVVPDDGIDAPMGAAAGKVVGKHG
jgi:hypothetical protein